MFCMNYVSNTGRSHVKRNKHNVYRKVELTTLNAIAYYYKKGLRRINSFSMFFSLISS